MAKQKTIVRISTKQVLERAAERWPQAHSIDLVRHESHAHHAGKFRYRLHYQITITGTHDGDTVLLYSDCTESLAQMLKRIEAAT